MRKSEASRLRRIIEVAVQSLDNNTALTVVNLYPKWEPNILCEAGKRYCYNDKLYQVNENMTHTSQADWTPDITPSMFTVVNETHTGTIDDPIPYDGNMVLSAGLYYIQDNIIYHCTRDTVNPVYNHLSELIGLYVEEVS